MKLEIFSFGVLVVVIGLTEAQKVYPIPEGSEQEFRRYYPSSKLENFFNQGAPGGALSESSVLLNPPAAFLQKNQQPIPGLFPRQQLAPGVAYGGAPFPGISGGAQTPPGTSFNSAGVPNTAISNGRSMGNSHFGSVSPTNSELFSAGLTSGGYNQPNIPSRGGLFGGPSNSLENSGRLPSTDFGVTGPTFRRYYPWSKLENYYNRGAEFSLGQ